MLSPIDFSVKNLGVCLILSCLSRANAASKAAYFLDNDPKGASVVSLNIAGDGSLSNPIRTSTGGVGALAEWIIPNPPDNTGFAGPDSLYSADSIVVSGEYLFVVNPGSNTLSFFLINPQDPQHPRLVGKPVNTLGDFPVSVDYSPKLNTACVLNGGARSGVSCFSVNKVLGLIPLDLSLRSIAPALNQTTPPAGPVLTASDIKFNPSSTALFVSTKGSPPSGSTPAILGSIYVWPVVAGLVSRSAKISQPAGVILDFSLTFLGTDSSILVADAASAAYILSVSSDLKVTVAHSVPYTEDEGLVCWGVFVPSIDQAFTMSASTTNITIVNPHSGAIEGIIALPAADQGAFDSAFDGTFLYSLTNIANIAVTDLSSTPPKVVQNLDLSSLGTRKGWEGLAIYN
ncbi:hypothetical protein F5884DRAFT_856075 [Xylogone sp. PMI_703]|nr:hypothetical protein F5884DRAFT_856075 [Xylogone sp. PMI_703]